MARGHHADADFERVLAARQRVGQLDFQNRCSLRDLAMKGEHLQRIALPGNRLSPGREFQAAEPASGSARPVRSRQPFRIKQGQRAGFDGDHKAGLNALVGDLAGIDGKRNRRGLAGTN